MGLEAVEFLLQGDEPTRSQVDVLQQHPTPVLGGRVDGLVGLSEALLRTDGDGGHAAAELGGQIVNAPGGVKSGYGAHQDGGAALQLVVDNVGLPSEENFTYKSP